MFNDKDEIERVDEVDLLEEAPTDVLEQPETGQSKDSFKGRFYLRKVARKTLIDLKHLGPFFLRMRLSTREKQSNANRKHSVISDIKKYNIRKKVSG